MTRYRITHANGETTDVVASWRGLLATIRHLQRSVRSRQVSEAWRAVDVRRLARPRMAA